MSVDAHSEARAGWSVTDTMAGFLATASIFASALGVVWRPARILPVAIVLALIAARMSARQQWLAAAGDFARTRPQIKGLVYFDAERTEGNEPYDLSLRTAPGSMAVFSALARNPYFRPAR